MPTRVLIDGVPYAPTQPPTPQREAMRVALYPLRPGDNEELRFSLRSVETNMPLVHEIWTVGDHPEWVTGHHHISGNKTKTGPGNVFDNILRACEHPDAPEWFVVMNDDFIILDPVEIPVTAYRQPLREHIHTLKNKNGWWHASLKTTLNYLETNGIQHPLSYELHRPMLINTKAMAKHLRAAAEVNPDNPPQWRTIYGNMENIGGYQATDGKAYTNTRWAPIGTPYLSTTDKCLGRVKVGGDRESKTLRDWLTQRFPRRSKWEAW